MRRAEWAEAERWEPYRQLWLAILLEDAYRKQARRPGFRGLTRQGYIDILRSVPADPVRCAGPKDALVFFGEFVWALTKYVGLLVMIGLAIFGGITLFGAILALPIALVVLGYVGYLLRRALMPLALMGGSVAVAAAVVYGACLYAGTCSSDPINRALEALPW